MKKIALLLLLFLYLIPAIGVTVSTHFCGGKIASVSFNPFVTNHKCPCGSKKMKKDCCKDETTSFKLDNEQQKTQQVLCNFVTGTSIIQPAILTAVTFGYKTALLTTWFEYHTHPPDDLKHSLFIRHCIFRI